MGIPFIEKARQLGIRNICIHKGLLFGGYPEAYGRCADVGRAAKLYPDVNFIIYHSGFETGHREDLYDPASAGRGVDTLVKSLEDNGIGPNGNVYAELGSTWRFVMRDPTTAAHLLGKLLVRVGQDNVLWGTDSIWYGSPQDQIQAFRAFQIAPELVERLGYPELTPELKRKVFGLNGARVYGIDVPVERKRTEADPLGARKLAYRERAAPTSRPSGRRRSASSKRSSRSGKECRPDTRSRPIGQGMAMMPTQGSRWAHPRGDRPALDDERNPCRYRDPATNLADSTPANGGSRAAAGSTAA